MSYSLYRDAEAADALLALRYSDERSTIMNEEHDKNLPEADEKAAYEAPKVIRVSLRPEEAVLGHCKITGHAGPVSGSCRSIVACRTVGS